MTRKLVLLVVATVCLAATAGVAASDNWPAFRGGDARNQVEDDPRLPETWSRTENVAWVADVPGHGWSSPVVWDDRVFLTTVTSEGEIEEPKRGLYFGGNRPEPPEDVHHWMVLAYDAATGDKVWETRVHSGRPGFARHLKNTYASETPTTDGERVYAYFGNVGVFALDWSGEVVWEHRFDVARTRYGWGTAASPVLHGDRLYVVNDNEEQSFFAALDKRTGEELWRTDRDEGSNWTTPFVWENSLRTELVTAGTDRVRSYSTDGELLWQFGGMSSIAIPMPFAAHGLLYVSSGYIGDQKRPVFAIRPGASGDISLADGQTSNEWIAWFLPQAGAYNPTPLIYGDYFYTVLDRGFFTMHDARTGEEVYGKQRIERGSSAFTASPWAYNGKIFVLSEDGDTFVIDAGREFEVLGKNSLDEMCMASPAIADGSLYVRTRTRLYRITNDA
ncbi:MAG: PQQ-binding-like beta-propeller repeat protein [Thermoanaerobaculia bacterium]|nr:PQQ-binding-like beta-propeller repeat protein [Thermoanaerobaculia bacterium]